MLTKNTILSILVVSLKMSPKTQLKEQELRHGLNPSQLKSFIFQENNSAISIYVLMYCVYNILYVEKLAI